MHSKTALGCESKQSKQEVFFRSACCSRLRSECSCIFRSSEMINSFFRVPTCITTHFSFPGFFLIIEIARIIAKRSILCILLPLKHCQLSLGKFSYSWFGDFVSSSFLLFFVFFFFFFSIYFGCFFLISLLFSVYLGK